MNARTLLIDALIERVADWPEEAQKELVRSLLSIEAQHIGTYQLSEDEQAEVQAGLDQADRGEFVSDEDMSAFFKRHGL